MKKIVMTLLVIGVLFVLGCTTYSGVDEKAPKKTSEKVSQKAASTPVEKTAVTEIKKIPFVVKETSFYSDGYVESYRVFTLDDDDKTIREDLFDSFDEIIESVVFENISATDVKRSIFNARGELQSWSMIINNVDGSLKRTESYSALGILQTASEYLYDSDGNKTSWSVTDGDNNVLSETKYAYQSGKNTKIQIYDTSMTMKEYFELVYDGDMLVKNSHFDETGKLKAAIEYLYVGGMLSEEKHLRANGSVLRTVKYENDDLGQPIKTRFFDGNGKLKDWNEKEYEYIIEERTIWE